MENISARILFDHLFNKIEIKKKKYIFIIILFFIDIFYLIQLFPFILQKYLIRKNYEVEKIQIIENYFEKCN